MYFASDSFCSSHRSHTIEVGAVLITAHCNLPITKFVEEARKLLDDLNASAGESSGDRAEYWNQDTFRVVRGIFQHLETPRNSM